MGPPRAKPARKRRKDGLPDSVSNGSRASNMPSWANRNASPCTVFVPERVVTLMDPPEAPLDSAERPLLTTWNSCTISGESSVRLEPVYSSLLSRPSMERLLLRDRRPPKVKPLPASGVEPLAPEAIGELETPGESRTKYR